MSCDYPGHTCHTYTYRVCVMPTLQRSNSKVKIIDDIQRSHYSILDSFLLSLMQLRGWVHIFRGGFFLLRFCVA